MSILNPADWNWTRVNAAGRHVASYSAGIVSALVFIHLLSSAQGSDIMGSLNLIFDGVGKIVTGIGGLVVTLTPIYTAWRASKAASPAEQAKSITALPPKQLAQVTNAVPDTESRNKLISAVADMDEVKKIQADAAVAQATESTKVVPAPKTRS